MPLTHETNVPAQPGEVPGIRRAVMDALPPTLGPSRREDVALMITELATNAIRHSGAGPSGMLRVCTFLGDERLRVEVEDQGAGFDVPGELPPATGSSGHGLRLIDRLADSWGMRPGARPPTVIWFEVGLQDPDGP